MLSIATFWAVALFNSLCATQAGPFRPSSDFQHPRLILVVGQARVSSMFIRPLTTPCA